MPSKISRLDTSRLNAYQPRAFIPENINLQNPDEVIAIFKKLIDSDIKSQKDLEGWLERRSEVDAAVHQQEAILYIRMTCQTDDKERADSYKKFIQTVIPAIEPLKDQFNRKFLDEKKKFSLDAHRYEIYTREIQNDVKLFREENVDLQTKESLLSQDYQTLCGEMTVIFEGKEHTLPEMSKFLLEPDRQLRELAWRAIAERRLKEFSNVKVVVGDGTQGFEEDAPYDAILVTAACFKIPDKLMDQLVGGGRIVIPLGNKIEQELIKSKQRRKYRSHL